MSTLRVDTLQDVAETVSLDTVDIQQAVVLRQDLASSDPAKGATLVRYAGDTVFNTLGYASPVPVPTLGGIAAANLPVGGRCSVNGTIFLISATPPRNARYPLISAGDDLYAIPVANHTASVLGTFVSKGTVINASDWALSNTRQQQGLEYDNRAGSVFLTSLVKPSTPEVGYLIEYAAASDGTIGAEIQRSGLLPMGHSDYFAIEYDAAGGRHIWVNETDQSKLHRIDWVAGATAANITQTVDFTGIASGRVEVSNYGADSLLLSFTRVDTGRIVDHVCTIDTLISEVFSPVQQWDAEPRLGAIVPIMPHQQRKAEGALFWGLSGLEYRRADYTFVGVGDEAGDVVSRAKYSDPSAASGDEPEGLGWYWDSIAAKLVPVMSIWRPLGSVDIYSVGEPGAATSNTLGSDQLARHEFDTTGTGMGQWGVLADGLMADFPMGIKHLLVGGGSYSTSDVFDPVNLRLTQVFDNATRQGGGLYAYGQANVLSLDGPNDLTFGLGARWFGATRTMMHLTEKGAFFGRASTLSEQNANKASLVGFGSSAYPVGVKGQTGAASTAPCFLSVGGSLDYAVPVAEAMQLGGYDEVAGTIATWVTVGPTNIAPGGDNTRSCGTAGLRWSVVYAGTGTINTSDLREKQQIRGLSAAERAVAVKLKRLIRAFKFNDAVKVKGVGARIHIGVIAQDVAEVFASEGLDAGDYAILCHDEWEETPGETDEYGNLLKAPVEAGDRYGVRYDQLLAFIIGATT